MKYLAKPLPIVDDYYYKEDSFVVNEQTRGFRPNAQGSNKENCLQGQENQGRNYGNYNREGQYIRDENYNHDNNFNRGNYRNRNDQSGPYVPPRNREVAPRDSGGSMARDGDMLQKMRRRFDASEEHAKDLRGDIANIGKNVNTYEISIKHLEL